MVIREAEIKDWDILEEFFRKIYRENHPLHSKEFWDWQYGDPQYGRSIIAVDNSGKVAGHRGITFGGGVAWMINLYLSPEHRDKGILRKMYDLARNYSPLASTAVNEAGLGLYRKMRWIRYHDLVRYVKINPYFENKGLSDKLSPSEVSIESKITTESHYLQQPGLTGIKVGKDSTAVSQEEVGGLRIVDLGQLTELEEEAWELGYKWMDYITSWNDLRINELIIKGWILDFKSEIPWRLNPVEEKYFCNISYLSEQPLPNEFIVHRSFSDHGRVGSLIQNEK